MKICSGNKISKWAVTFLRLYVFPYKSRDVLSSKSSKQCLKQLYFLFIHNYINYTNIAWASINKSNLGRLYRYQNMLLVFFCLYSAIVKASPICKMSEACLSGKDQRCYVVSIIPGSSARFLHLHFRKFLVFHFQRRNSIRLKNWRERMWYICLTKRWYIVI